MRAEAFLDTNVLVYAAAGRGSEEAKRQRALGLIGREEIGTSAQVLQEFYVTVTRKTEIPWTPGKHSKGSSSSSSLNGLRAVMAAGRLAARGHFKC